MAHTTPRTPALAAFLAGRPLEPVGFVGGRPVWPIAGGSESATDTTTETETGGGETTETSSTETTTGEATTETGGGTPTKVELTPEQQKMVDGIISDRLASERKKHAAELKQMQEDAGKSDLERLTAERDRYREQAENGSKAAGERLARTEAKLAARVAGARDDRLDDVVRMADLTDAVGADGEIDETKVKAAIESVLGRYGEWKRTPGKSGGDLDGGGSGPKSFTEAQIAAMSPEEYEKNRADILAAFEGNRVSKG